MDEKTAELRDIFLDATGEEAVTEHRTESRGSLADTDDPERVDARLRELVTTMRERYEFETDLDTGASVRLIRGFYDGRDDEELAEELDVDAETVVQARLDLHLVREADRDTDAFETIRARIDADEEPVAADLDCDAETVARARRVVEAEREATRANDRFRDAFAELLTDDDLTGRLASDSREDGLGEATEDIETNVSF
ncbi:MAG: conditioned medium-induced protein 4 [Haloplanus sp.]